MMEAPRVGSLITFIFMEYTKEGIPEMERCSEIQQGAKRHTTQVTSDSCTHDDVT